MPNIQFHNTNSVAKAVFSIQQPVFPSKHDLIQWFSIQGIFGFDLPVLEITSGPPSVERKSPQNSTSFTFTVFTQNVFSSAGSQFLGQGSTSNIWKAGDRRNCFKFTLKINIQKAADRLNVDKMFSSRSKWSEVLTQAYQRFLRDTLYFWVAPREI